jgi:hypothetical protein
MSCREQAPEPKGFPKYCEAFRFISGSGVVLTTPLQCLLKGRNDARILRVQHEVVTRRDQEYNLGVRHQMPH